MYTHILHFFHRMKKKRAKKKKEQEQLRAEAESLGVPLNDKHRHALEMQAKDLREKLNAGSQAAVPASSAKGVSQADVAAFMEQLQLGKAEDSSGTGKSAEDSSTAVATKIKQKTRAKNDATCMIHALQVGINYAAHCIE